MSKGFCLSVSLIAIATMLAGCAARSEPGTIPLAFRAPMNVDSSQRFHVSLGVENVGDSPFHEYQTFNGAMKLHDDAGEEVGRIQVTTLWELAPGEAAWPAAYASKLPAGASTAKRWSARCGYKAGVSARSSP
jgi:hypothetical protein